MPATIIPLHIMDDEREFQARAARCDQEANWYFAQATKREKAEFDATMKGLLGVTGPRWDRAREAARAKWRKDTAEAAALLDRTVDCLMETGEVSDELDALWTELFDRNAVAEAMEAAE